jgi:hypothetical protein
MRYSRFLSVLLLAGVAADLSGGSATCHCASFESGVPPAAEGSAFGGAVNLLSMECPDEADERILAANGPDEPPETEGTEGKGVGIETNDPEVAAPPVELDPRIGATAREKKVRQKLSPYMGAGFDCRDEAVRGRFLEKAGGNAASEAAVAAALNWFAEHQYPDGSWNFDHARCPKCRGRCPNPGDLREATRAATAMALLPLLGAGQTHLVGKHKATVKRGLAYLVASMQVRGDRGSLDESGGRMYAHGLGSITLCEAYAMTRDKGLLRPAQQCLSHIAYAQDPVGGGWRYMPKQPGDTSVFGWQLAALKTGHAAHLNVNPTTVKGAIRFLDSVQAANGAQYGYTAPATGRDATTAIGLLCRMYLGWSRQHPPLQEGVKYLANKGPSKSNMYFNYYATQVMRHYEGDPWKKWNQRMRDYLLLTQDREGHATGSWHFGWGDHGSAKGGRVYCTSLATMILEVYYRHPPIYQKQAADDEFPL